MAASFSIGQHFEAMVDGLVESGRYKTADDVIQAGLRLVESREQERQAKLETLRTEIQKGIDSGPAEDVGDMFERIKSEGRRKLAAKDAAE